MGNYGCTPWVPNAPNHLVLFFDPMEPALGVIELTFLDIVIGVQTVEGILFLLYTYSVVHSYYIPSVKVPISTSITYSTSI